ncbi:MAG: hypothetical protein ACQEWU_05155 [Bacillota bacterium]
MKRILFSLCVLILVILVGCSDKSSDADTESSIDDETKAKTEELEKITEVDADFKEKAKEIANMFKSIYESGNAMSVDELKKFEEFLHITEIGGRELTPSEIAIQSDLIKLNDLIIDEDTGNLVFEVEYQALLNKLD